MNVEVSSTQGVTVVVTGRSASPTDTAGDGGRGSGWMVSWRP